MTNAKKIRLTNLLAAALMVLVGVLEILFGNTGLLSLAHVSSLFMILFGLMTAAGDMNLPFILEWCGFLGHFVYRGIFTIYCSVNLFHVSTKLVEFIRVIATISAWIVFALGLFLIMFGTCFRSSEYAADVEEFMATK
jgi:hypothetical protein